MTFFTAFFFWRHSDKTGAAINNRYLNFVQTCDLMSLVNDDHMDNEQGNFGVCVYVGSIVNNRPKNMYLHFARIILWQNYM